jgi:(+)-pinoresinol hydroxylase
VAEAFEEELMRRAIAIVLLVGGVQAAGAAQPAATPEVSGEAVYQHWCSHCHNAGRGNPGTESLRVKYGDKLPAVLLERTDLTPQVVAQFVRQGVLSMAPFRKTEITDAELAVLSEFVAKKK